MASWPYNTATWQRLREVKLSQDPLCQYCPPGSYTPADQVDHRVPISKGGEPFDLANLASSCQRCHSRKTMHVDVLGKAYVPKPGVDPATGLPLDGNHWWNDEKSLRAEGARPPVPPNCELDRED